MLFTKAFWLHVAKDAVTSFITGVAALAASGNLTTNIGWAGLAAAVFGVLSAVVQKVGQEVEEAGV